MKLTISYSWAKHPKLKELGKYQLLSVYDALQPYTLRLFTNNLGWKKEEIEVLYAKVRRELSDRSIHMYGV